jgi:signal peptidase
LKVGEEKYKTKGDNNNAEDRNLVNKEDVVATYAFKIQGLGYVLNFIRRYFIIIIIGVLVVSILIACMVKVIRSDSNEKV